MRLLQVHPRFVATDHEVNVKNARGVAEDSRGSKSAATIPPVSDQKGVHPGGVPASFLSCTHFCDSSRLDTVWGRVPGVSLRSTPGNFLAALQADVNGDRLPESG